MSADVACPATAYRRHVRAHVSVILVTFVLLLAALVVAVSLGAVPIAPTTVAKGLAGLPVGAREEMIIRAIRLPQALAAIAAGAGLAVAGAVMQSILRNPLGSPFTLGISHAAAFGAALAVMITSTSATGSSDYGHPLFVTLAAFTSSLLAAGIIILVSRRRGATPESMVLAGVALGALFTAATMFLQFFADDVQLGAMVFWAFGDTARASWQEVLLLLAGTAAISLFFFAASWRYNALDAGDDTAKSLGVPVERTRIAGMLLSSLLTAIIISLLGVIGFVGLVVPHLMRRLVGADHRFLLPAAMLGGALLLLLSDTAARLILAPQALPVSVLTAFMGAPLFLFLILRRQS